MSDDRPAGYTFLRWWLAARAEAEALRAQLAVLEAQWLAAEHAADYWYFEANNPEEAREARRQRTSTAHIDVRLARQATAERWAALDAAEEARAS